MHKFLQSEHILKLTDNDYITATTSIVGCDRFRFDESGYRGDRLHCGDSGGGASGGDAWAKNCSSTVDESTTAIQDPTELWVKKLVDGGGLGGEDYVGFARNLGRQRSTREFESGSHSSPSFQEDTNIDEPSGQPLSTHVSPFMGFDSPDSSYSRIGWADPNIGRASVGGRNVTKHGYSMMEETTVTTGWGASNTHSSSSNSTWNSMPEIILPNCDIGDGRGCDLDRCRSLHDPSSTSCSTSTHTLTTLAPALATTRKLSCDGFRVIMVNIIEPLLGNHLLVEFHQDLRLVVRKMQKGSIPTLRDLEKVLLFDRGPAIAITVTSYLRLCCEFLERSRKVVELLQPLDLLSSISSSSNPKDDKDGKDDKDRHLHSPYDPTYFLNAWQSARVTAQIKFNLGRSEVERAIKNMRSEQEPASSLNDDNMNTNITSSFSSAWGRLEMGPQGTPWIAAGKTSLFKRQILGSANSDSACKKNQVVDEGGDNLAIVTLQPSSSTEENREQSATEIADQQQQSMFTMPKPQTQDIINKSRCLLDPQTIAATITGNPTPAIQNNIHHHHYSPVFNNAPSTHPHSFNDSTGTTVSPSSTSSDVDYRQPKRLRTSAAVPPTPISGTPCLNTKRFSLAPPSPPESTSTSVQSDGSTSPRMGGDCAARKMKTTEMKSYVCGRCDKEFPRACDLTKHRKTHDRPFKCSEASCRYASTGFSAEKDRDRHYQDKHDKNAPKIQCHWKCGYMSPRESNVKQHMEKAHGYHYIRTKSVHKSKPPDNRSLKRKPLSPEWSIESASPSLTSPQHQHLHQIQQPTRGREYVPSESSSSLGLFTPSPQMDVEANDNSPDSTVRSTTTTPCHNNLPFFPPLNGPTTSQSISPAFIQTSEPYYTAQYPSLFQSPSGAVQAMNDRKGNRSNSSNSNADINGKERCAQDENARAVIVGPGRSRGVGNWHNVNKNNMHARVGAMNPNTQIDPLLVGEDGDVDLMMSPEFVDTFLVDAPEDILERVEHDTRLPIVHNYVYDEDRERVLTC